MAEAEGYNSIEAIRLQAKQLGIKYGPNTTIESLRNQIQQKLLPEANNDFYKRRKAYVDENKRLVRVSITDFDPDDVGKQGLIYTFANQVLGKMCYYVPISGKPAQSWHLPKAFVNMLKDLKYTHKQQVETNKEARISTREMPKFKIEELKPLTQAELDDLKAAQKGRLEAS